jgi:hypothetical protein
MPFWGGGETRRPFFFERREGWRRVMRWRHYFWYFESLYELSLIETNQTSETTLRIFNRS